jgi:ATP-dependent DNA helicase Q1
VKILENAAKMDIKLTALKLIDAWFHKGPGKLRLEIPPPSIDRFYAEQIVAFLLIDDYLREDFHYTAYSTISYIQRGPTAPQDDEIEFHPSRIYDLPPMKDLKDFLQATTTNDADEVSFVSEKKTDLNRSLRKRRVSSSSEDSDSNDMIKSPFKTSSIEKMIEKKVESKLRKIFGDNEELRPSTSSARVSDEVVLLTPKKEEPEIIEID